MENKTINKDKRFNAQTLNYTIGDLAPEETLDSIKKIQLTIAEKINIFELIANSGNKRDIS